MTITVKQTNDTVSTFVLIIMISYAKEMLVIIPQDRKTIRIPLSSIVEFNID